MAVFRDTYFGSSDTCNGQIVKILVYQEWLKAISAWNATSQGQLHFLPICMGKFLHLDCSSLISGWGETASFFLVGIF